MTKKRATLAGNDAAIPSANADIFQHTEPEPEEKKGFTRNEKKYNQRHGKPTTYRLPVPLADRIRAIAKAEGVGLSELARFVLTGFVRDYDAGRVELPKQQQSYTLDFDPIED